MRITQHFSQTGEFFFRFRSYLPFIVLPLAIYSLKGYNYPLGYHWLDLLWEALCFSVSLIGVFIRFWVSGTSPIGTSGRNTKSQKAQVLNTTGPYSIVRHPLYLGNYLVFLGICLFTRNFWFILVASSLFVLYYERIIFREEEFLENKFGNEFRVWANKTPMIIPKFSLYKPSNLRFSWKAAIRREFHVVFLLTSLYFALEVIADFVVYGKFVLDMLWTIIFLIGLAFYLTVRIIKKTTTFFHTSDR